MRVVDVTSSLCFARRLVLGIVLATLPIGARAQSHEEPSSNPGQLDIQSPQPRIIVFAGISASDEYRDRLLSRNAVATSSANIAYEGFSLSFWQAHELSTSHSVGEITAGYSHKVYFADLHADFVACHGRLPHGCADGFRFTATSNSIKNATIELSLDEPVGSRRETLAASVIYDVYYRDRHQVSVRFGWAKTNYPSDPDLEGVSLRVIASQSVSQHISVDGFFGHGWNLTDPRSGSPSKGLLGGVSLVGRF